MATTPHDVTPLLDIQHAEFAHQYQLGAWWSLYGDEQGTGPKPDTYFLDNMMDLIKSGHANDLKRGWFPNLGFFLGMIHGGVLHPQTNAVWSYATTLVTLSNPSAIRGYQAGRVWFFYESGEHEHRLTDTDLMQRLQELADEQPYYQDVQRTIDFTLGCMLGELSGQLFPLTQEEHEQIQEEDRQFLAEQEARSTALKAA